MKIENSMAVLATGLYIDRDNCIFLGDEENTIVINRITGKVDDNKGNEIECDIRVIDAIRLMADAVSPPKTNKE